MAIKLARPRLLRFNGTSVTDHNRSELSVDVERIETTNRMANGTLRKYHVADKRTFAVSWDSVPNVASQTVDGFWSGKEIENFFNSTTGSFTLGVTGRDGVETNYIVMFTDFSRTVVKRWATWELWNVNITLEEV